MMIQEISSQKQVRELVNLYQETWENSFGIIDLLKTETICFLMLDENEKVIGYAFVEEDKKRGFVELHDIAISKKIQNQGLGKKMMHFLQKKFSHIKLIANVEKANLVPFYKSLNFEIQSILENYYDVGVDGARMAWKKQS